MSIVIKELDQDMICSANRNSMSGKRGDLAAESYQCYCDTMSGWPVSEAKKQELLDKTFTVWQEILRHEAQHVSVAVDGPSGYRAERMDHSDKILSLSNEFAIWFSKIECQVSESLYERDKGKKLISMIKWVDYHNSNPAKYLVDLAHYDKKKFLELYEQLLPKYHWRKNTRVAKAYEGVKSGEIQEIKAEIFFQDENFKAYVEGDRAYIRFPIEPKRQLKVAMKSRGWWWNSREAAWSTYLDRLDKEWVSTISKRYKEYL